MTKWFQKAKLKLFNYIYNIWINGVNIINKLLYFFWLELIKKQKNPYKRIKDMKIDVVLDIGANTWQFLSKNISIFPNAMFHSFEPLPKVFKILQRKFFKNTSVRLYNIWLWSEEDEMIIHESEYNPSSSLLEMTDIHKNAFPHTKESQEEKVKVKKLDDLNITWRNMLIKIDTQWYEKEIIKWWINTIKKAKICIIETSFFELYKNQPLFADIYKMMIEIWFIYYWSYDQLYNPINWSILQQDMIFIRQEANIKK